MAEGADAPQIPAAARSALKEWAAVEAALERGSSVMLLRKGGIYEQKHGFQVEHRQFWLFPTLFHQSPADLAPSFEWAIREAIARHEPGPAIRIGSYAVVTDALRVERFDALERLAGLHPFAGPTVQARFHYRKRPYLHVLVVRHHVLEAPHRVRTTAEYEGCISWVELDEPLATAGLRPVMEARAFEDERRRVLDALGQDGVTRL
jgi:hypothetical protein